jgi:serine phosphatase RsbU (regulator of sigma subunit)
VPSASQSETATGIFRRDAVLASGVPSLQNAIDLTNNYIATQHGNSNMFATVFFGLLDPSDGTLAYINAGHEAPLLFSNGTLKTRLEPTGPAVGMLPNLEFRTEWVILSPGDSLLLYTDGVTDAMNVGNEPFSEERLAEASMQSSPSSESLIKNVTAAVDAHMGSREQYDDITLLAVHRRE